MSDGLKQKHRQSIVDILAACEGVERVVLFGSRATGAFSTGSDIDLALFGDTLTDRDQGNLAEAIEYLTVPQIADLHLYKTITSEKLKRHIARDGVEWFNCRA